MRGAVWLRRLLSVGIAALVLLYLLGYEVGDLPRLVDSPTPTQVASDGQGRRDLFVLPDDGAGVVLDELSAAERTIDIAVYLLTADEVVDALGDAEDRGVRVRVLLEPNPFGGFGDVGAGAAQLRALGAEVRFSGKDVRFSHIKMIVVDERVALVTSLNLTGAALSDNRELGVVSTEPSVVGTAVDLFRADWDDSTPPEPGPLVISPLNSRDTIDELIGSAETSIDVYAEVIHDERVIEQLEERSSEGVAVRVIVPDEVSPDDADLYAGMALAGIEVRSIGTPYQHSKMILIDGARALIGSINLTETSIDDNREAGIVLEDALSVGRLAAVYEEDWSTGTVEG